MTFWTVEPPLKLRYREDIDGLRAISIILVVGFHAFPLRVPGGFIGVDVFFVISGYLITRLIAERIDSGTWSILDFYRRRVVRIFPALLTVLIATYLAGFLFLLPQEMRLLAENVVAGAGFFSNILQIRDADYFAPSAASNPLLHLWSLGIEEQFYILWPFVMMLAHVSRRPLAVLLAIVATSMALNILLVTNSPVSTFYSPITRAWELCAGGIVATIAVYLPPSRPLHEIGAWLGAALIAVGAYMLSAASAYPGWNGLFPVAGASLLIASRSSYINNRVLAVRPLVFLGLISFPLYLWHWPIFVFTTQFLGRPLTGTESGIAIAASLLLAVLTYTFIERAANRRPPPQIVPMLAGGLVVAAGVGVITVAANGFEFRTPQLVRDIAMTTYDKESFRQDCFRYPDAYATEFSQSCIEKGKGPLVWLWGDSTAAMLYRGLKRAQSQVPFRLAQLTSSTCRPLMNFAPAVMPQCPAVNEKVLALIAENRPDIILLESVWELGDIPLLDDTIRRLRKINVNRIVLLGPMPVFGILGLPKLATDYYKVHRTLVPARMNDAFGRRTDIDDALKRFAAEIGIEYISPWSAFCDDTSCQALIGPNGTDLIALDQSHLTAGGSEFFIKQILPQLFKQPTPDTKLHTMNGSGSPVVNYAN
jgi:peptidoglycan/LPS O-acetylase OafA/YrhL